MNKDYIIKKSNYFVMNSHYNLSIEEQKIILTLASMVKPEDEEFKSYRFGIAEFINLVGIKNRNQYTEIPRITKELMKKVFEIQEKNKIIQVAWLSSAIYEKGSGYVELEFSPHLKPYMLKLNSMFTQYKLGNILMMKSKYSPRFYEFLKCNEFKKQGFEIELNELKYLLKIEDTYKRFYDFKKKVLLYSQKEINELTDITFSFQEIKKGRKIDKIKFYISSSQKYISQTSKQEPEVELDIDDLIDQLQDIIKEPLRIKEYKAILAAAQNDINIIIAKYNIAKRQGNIDNLVGWLIKAIETDYYEPISKGSQSKNKFNDFPQREYTLEQLEELERSLLLKDLEI